MARKSNSSHKKKVPDAGCGTNDKGQGKANGVEVFPAEELRSDYQKNGLSYESPRRSNQAGSENKINQSTGKLRKKPKEGLDERCEMDESVSYGNDPRDSASPLAEASGVEEETVTLRGNETGPGHGRSGMGFFRNGFDMNNMKESIEFSRNLIVRNLRESTLSMFKTTGEWLEKQRPYFSVLKNKASVAHGYVKVKFGQTYPIILKWLLHIGNLVLLLSMVWLDCALRGIDSFLSLGTSSFFSVIWCSVLSVFAMVGFFKFLVALVITALVGVFIGFTLGLLVLAISGTVFLWLYGSFWTTALVIIIGGLAFMLSRERVALLITTVYSIYCAWTYVGWIGLLLAFNLSFISSDILIYILKNNISQQRRSYMSSEQSMGTEGRPGLFDGESSETNPGMSADRSPGVASTSGADSELNSEDEVVRLLNCTDHYSALGLARYENVDVSWLKKEYRKKAMLVHPDKNMGNEKAAEAFKKLQNAYEVLLDSLKRKAYDEELRKEDLLNYLRRFQSTSLKNGGHGHFRPGADGEDPFGESRRIACKKCNDFHVWVFTKRSKSQARWCQECKDFHQAKDGDGWVEQSSQPLFFGMLQKVDAPSAYICADSKIYDATEWYICQGMRCPANTHKPSFHVNTSIASKHSTSKGSSSGQKGNRMPTSNMEETMTEEEFFEWLQNAVQSGMFNNVNGNTSAESPSARPATGPKNSGGGGSGSKRKKKGKKQW